MGATVGRIATHFDLGRLALERERYAEARDHLETMLAVKERFVEPCIGPPARVGRQPLTSAGPVHPGAGPFLTVIGAAS